jgi:hypothetical protein
MVKKFGRLIWIDVHSEKPSFSIEEKASMSFDSAQMGGELTPRFLELSKRITNETHLYSNPFRTAAPSRNGKHTLKCEMFAERYLDYPEWNGD